MPTPVSPAAQANYRTPDRSIHEAVLSIPTYVYAVVFSSLCIVWGLLWDIMWHMSIGRDGLFSPPHVLIYVGAVVAGLFSGFKILQLTFVKNHPERSGSVRFWGLFYGSLGAMYCVWGALAMLTSAPFDDWWHNTYGLDVQILTPPHTVLLVGMMVVQFGAMVGVLALQNRSADLPTLSPTQPGQTRQLKVLFAIAAGLLLSILCTMLAEKLTPSRSHSISYYTTACIAFPFFLLAVGRASLLRYPITALTAVYMLVMVIPSWILPLFPATPRLGPVLNPLTHYQPFIFPLLLVVPGFALDKLLHRYDRPDNRLNSWLLAMLAGTLFLTLFLAVQWFFGPFLKESPSARNWFFLSESLSYGNDPNSPYRYKMRTKNLPTFPEYLQGLGLALVYAILSARVGLWWGGWMKRVQR